MLVYAVQKAFLLGWNLKNFPHILSVEVIFTEIFFFSSVHPVFVLPVSVYIIPIHMSSDLYHLVPSVQTLFGVCIGVHPFFTPIALVVSPLKVSLSADHIMHVHELKH